MAGRDQERPMEKHVEAPLLSEIEYPDSPRRERPWYIWQVEDVVSRIEPHSTSFLQRLVAGWWVVTGRAHAVIWPDDQ
jgi:hypothetical protein